MREDWYVIPAQYALRLSGTDVAKTRGTDELLMVLQPRRATTAETAAPEPQKRRRPRGRRT